MTATSIEWADRVWNPVTGCEKIAQGCKYCYAETLAKRFWGERPFSDVRTHPDRLDAPLRWRKPARVFVNSMSDLFHDAVPFKFIAAVYGVMAACPQHTFIILTKRPARMLEFCEWSGACGDGKYRIVLPKEEVLMLWHDCAVDAKGTWFDDEHTWRHRLAPCPLPNIQHGVSVSTQADADALIPILRRVPSAKRIVSVEPLLEAVDIGDYLKPRDVDDDPDRVWLDGVLVGGESGPGARPCDVAWIRSIVQQCKASGTKCFVKQLGAEPTSTFDEWNNGDRTDGKLIGDVMHWQLRDRKGADPEEWPEDLRVRELV